MLQSLLLLCCLLPGCSMYRASQISLGACAIADVASTMQANRAGRTELNPAFRNSDGSANIPRLVAIKGVSNGVYLGAQELDPKRRKLYTILNLAIAGTHCTALAASR